MQASTLNEYELIHRGKVRDIYALDEHNMLIVTTDRLSAFDVILPDPIPGKGEVLTTVSNFWMKRTTAIVPNHFSEKTLNDFFTEVLAAELAPRSNVVKRLKALPVEAIVRGYIIGSGWKDYQATGEICGIALPLGLQQAQQLPKPIFTPSTKADVGDHDENVSFAKVVEEIGVELAEQVREVSIALYQHAAEHARQAGIIIADTKFEFGLDGNNRLTLIDEALTPDSSRFWPADEYQVGISPPSFDKQFVRDYLETLDWDKQAPGPVLPNEIIEKTAAKYNEAKTRLLG